MGGHINQYLAIAWDEIGRMKDCRVEYVTNLFLLVDRRITRADCVAIIEEAGLRVPERSCCYFCPFNSVDRWRWLHANHPSLYEKAVALEERSKHFPAQRLTDQAFRKRADISLRTLGRVFDGGGSAPAGATMVDQQPCGAECDT